MVAQSEEGILSPFLAKKRMIKVLPFLNGSVLDYGCGVGDLSEVVDKDYVGFDIDNQSLSIANQRYPNKIFINELTSEHKYDTIIMLAVIEHLDNPLDELKILIKNHTNKDFRIVITTPNKYFDKVHHFGARLKLFSTHASDEHNIMFGKNDLFQLAKDLGLKVFYYKKFLFFANQIVVIKNKES
ncbi:MAG: class I SAM-dependent methyltransferase [Pseudomonadota bacterium]|nr:class I SAM-dependent methyltransferase [Pseudomonadota bacterium]